MDEDLKQGERLKMRIWLEQVINNGDFQGVEWTDKRRGKFRVPWMHASRHGWNIEKDASIFKTWAIYTGKYPDNCENMSQEQMKKLAKVWKANFRCALNALQDVEVLREEGVSKGKDAFKVFQIVPRKLKSRTVRLNSQGSEENSLTVKIRKRSGVTTTKTFSQKKQKVTKVAEEPYFYPRIEHNYSETWPSFNMKNGVGDVPQEILSSEPSSEDLENFLNSTMQNAANTGVQYYGDDGQYCSSEDIDANSSGSDGEYNTALAAQLIASPSYNLSSLNINQSIEGICSNGQYIQDPMKTEYTNAYEVANVYSYGAKQFDNNHFKDGATDPFCGDYGQKELNLAMQFRI